MPGEAASDGSRRLVADDRFGSSGSTSIRDISKKGNLVGYSAAHEVGRLDDARVLGIHGNDDDVGRRSGSSATSNQPAPRKRAWRPVGTDASRKPRAAAAATTRSGPGNPTHAQMIPAGFRPPEPVRKSSFRLVTLVIDYRRLQSRQRVHVERHKALNPPSERTSEPPRSTPPMASSLLSRGGGPPRIGPGPKEGYARTRDRTPRLYRLGHGRVLTQAGHDVTGLDSTSMKAALRRRQHSRCRRFARTSGTSSRAISRLRRRHPSRGALERPARLPRRSVHLRHQPPRQRQAGARPPRPPGVPRFLFASSCSLYGAAGDTMLDETRRVQSDHGVRQRRRCWSSRTSRSSRTILQPDLPAQRDRVRLRRRACAPTSSSTTSSASPTRPAKCSSRATARRGGRSSTSRTSRARFWPCSKRRARLVHNQAFNVGSSARELPDPRRRRHGAGGRARAAR